MGYTTDFSGSFQLNKPLSPKMKEFLIKLNETRRMGRRVDSKYGVEGEFFVDGSGFMGQGDDKNIIDHNEAPATQPGLWLKWRPDADGTAIVWDGAEKFDYYTEWLVYLIHKILAPNGYVLNGKVTWQGEETGDVGEITVKNNKVFTKAFKGKKEEHTPENCEVYVGTYKKREGVDKRGYLKNFMRTDVVYLENGDATEDGEGEREFEVQVSRTVTAFRTIKVKAKNAADAEEKALDCAGDYDFGTGDNADYQVVGSTEITKKKTKA